jgi:hypothetical protein
MKLTILERPTSLTAEDFRVRLEKELKELKGELTASLTVDGFSRKGWAQIRVTGEDSEIVSELISSKFGLAHTELREMELPGVYEAEITGSNERGLRFDVGLDSGPLNCVIPTSNLIAQLADGKPIHLGEVVECYCLYPGVRISVRIARTKDDAIEAWLSDRQIDRLARWITTGLDRIQAFECYRQEAESAVLKTHSSRDVIAVESISLTLQSIVCKLGTDAVGLIPKLGHILRKQKLRPFIPKKIIGRCRPWQSQRGEN